MERPQTVDDLSHEWPPDVLRYESRYFLGLTLNEMLLIAIPGVGLLLTGGLALGVLGFVGAFLSVKKFEALGGRRFPVYVAARLLHARRNRVLTLPLIMPAGGEAVIMTTWDGTEMLRIGEFKE